MGIGAGNKRSMFEYNPFGFSRATTCIDDTAWVVGLCGNTQVVSERLQPFEERVVNRHNVLTHSCEDCTIAR